MDTNKLKEIREKEQMIEKQNNMKPRDRVGKDKVELKNWIEKLKKIKENEANQDNHIVIGIRKSCCYKPIPDLNPITLSAMKIPIVHTSHYLLGRILTEPISHLSISFLIEDINGDIEEISLYNFRTNFENLPTWLKIGTILYIKEPYLKYKNLNEDQHIRVDSPSDIVVIDEADEDFLKRIHGMKWYREERRTFDELKLLGNENYKKKNYEEALKFYTRALRKQPDSAIIYLNLSATFLALENYFKAYQNSKLAIYNNADKEKALFRLGKAAYGLHEWQKASQHFLELIKLFPNCANAKDELNRALARLKESRSGLYNISKLYYGFHEENIRNFDVADYTGPVKVENISGKGKGLIATSDIGPGTLLMVSKAFSTIYPRSTSDFNVIDVESDYIISKTQYLHMVETMDVLRKNPYRTKELYSKYSGGVEPTRDSEIPEGVVDAGRIEKICVYNHDVLYLEKKSKEDDDPIGLWLLPSYMNHSCLGNAYRTSYGDTKIVYSIDYIKSGDEITFNYINPDKSMDLQERIRVQVDGDFRCQCRLCELDRSDRLIMQREKLCDQIMSIQHLYSSSGPEQAIKLIDPLLEKLRLTYQKRKELQAQMFVPLNSLAMLNFEIREYEKCANLLKEFEEKILEYKYVQASNMGIEALLTLSKCYQHRENHELAKKYEQKAFHMFHMRSGADENVFKNIFY